MDDEKIIELFFARSEQAISELDKKYGPTCRRLSGNILNNPQDAEECVNDAYLGTWNAIQPERPNPLLAFLCKIVRHLSVKRYHANTAMRRNSAYDVALDELESTLASQASVEDELDARSLAGMIDTFLDALSEENRVIFMRRYWYSDTYAEIAERVGLNEKTVSVRLTRARKQLREFLIEKEVLT